MKKLNTRLPDDVHAKLATMAAADRRSLNSMIIVLIEEADRERDSPAP
jgi:predicted HicB family RNase H-like nuclease